MKITITDNFCKFDQVNPKDLCYAARLLEVKANLRIIDILKKEIPDNKKTIGQPWYEVAMERIKAGEPEEVVMRDYGFVRKGK